jgi:flagellar assembly factor FliW
MVPGAKEEKAMVAVANPTMTVRLLGGLAGLEEYTAYRMITEPDEPVCWLQSIDEEAVALPCADALAVLPDYQVELSDETVAELGIETAEDVRVLLVIQNWGDPERLTLSTGGPIVVNTHTGMAKQIVL